MQTGIYAAINKTKKSNDHPTNVWSVAYITVIGLHWQRDDPWIGDSVVVEFPCIMLLS